MLSFVFINIHAMEAKNLVVLERGLG